MFGWIYIGLLALSLGASLLTDSGQALGVSLLEGASAGAALGLSLLGPLCLWSGVGRVMEGAGLSDRLASLCRPLLGRIFPESRQDPALARDLGANFCANLLGLGNAATPAGIRAARRLRRGDRATDGLCRLIVLNTASIQLLPTSVAAIRSGLGSASPFDILPAVWITSFCSAGLGLGLAWILGRCHD